MSRKLLAVSMCLVVLLGAAGCTTTAATPTAAPTAVPTPASTAASKAIVLGEISNDPATTIKAYRPLADYLAAHLSQFGITVGAVKVAPDQDTMVKWLKDGTVDLYFSSPYTAMIMNDQAGAAIILRRWKSGVPQYHSLIMVRKDSGIKTLADLKGHLVAFDEPFSTTAYMLPLAYMLQGGLKAVQVSSAESTVPADEVGYVFAEGQTNVTAWLVNGKVPAGAFSDQDLKDVPADVMNQLTPVVQTEDLPRYLTLIRSGVDPAETQAIKTLLTGLDKTPEGPGILQTFEKTSKFDELPDANGMLTRMRELYQLVKAN